MQTLLQDSPSFRRTVVMMVLISILLFDWQPDSRLLSAPAQRREEDRPSLRMEARWMPLRRERRAAHLESPPRPMPGVRQAARGRTVRRG